MIKAHAQLKPTVNLETKSFMMPSTRKQPEKEPVPENKTEKQELIAEVWTTTGG